MIDTYTNNQNKYYSVKVRDPTKESVKINKSEVNISYRKGQ